MNLASLPEALKSRLNLLNLEPLTRFQFAVVIEGVTAAGFNEVAGIESSTDVREVLEGGYPGVHKYPRINRFGPITLMRGLTFSRALWDWRQEVVQWTKGRTDYTHSISIYMLSQIQLPQQQMATVLGVGGALPYEVYRFDLSDAWPSDWKGPDLNSMSEEIAIETITIQHSGLAIAEGIFSGLTGEAAGMLV